MRTHSGTSTGWCSQNFAVETDSHRFSPLTLRVLYLKLIKINNLSTILKLLVLVESSDLIVDFFNSDSDYYTISTLLFQDHIIDLHAQHNQNIHPIVFKIILILSLFYYSTLFT